MTTKVFTDIRLQNFRSYEDSSFELDGGVNIVVGPNTAGKTNLLEAIMVPATGKSYKARDAELIGHSAEWARIDTHDSDNRQRTVKINLNPAASRSDKTFELDGKELKKLSFEVKQPVVLFEPNHMFLFHDEPKKRREFLDGLIAQTDPEFQKTLNSYKRALAQRNSLLKQNKDMEQIFIWNFKLSDLGGKIARERLDLIAKINQSLGGTYSSLASKKTKVELGYKTDVSKDNYSSNLLKKLETNFARDKEQGFTGSGPHRDDAIATINGTAVSETASRGEIRTLVLSLKIIETQLVEERTSKKPTLLLDDVFSELDGARRKALTDFLKKYQTVITTTDADVVVKNFSQNCQIIPL